LLLLLLQVSLQQQVSRLEAELAVQYERYRNEFDARKLLIADINELRSLNEELSAAKNTTTAAAVTAKTQESSDKEDPVMLRIALRCVVISSCMVQGLGLGLGFWVRLRVRVRVWVRVSVFLRMYMNKTEHYYYPRVWVVYSRCLLLFRKAREDEANASRRLNEMIANYGDVIPRREFQELQQEHSVLLLLLLLLLLRF